MIHRLLLLSAAVGAGHTRAAQALERACRTAFPSIEVMHKDALDFLGRLVKKVYIRSYLAAVNHTPELWGYFYHHADRIDPASRRARVSRLIDRASSGRLARLVRRFRPDRIVCTHFLPASQLCEHRGADRVEVPVDVVLTDYDVHEIWIHPGVHRYYASTGEVRAQVIAKGIPAGHVTVSGIPIDPVFSKSRPAARARQAFALDPDLPVVLVMGGGFGVGDIEEAVHRLLRLGPASQVVVFAGRNDRLRRRLLQESVPGGRRLFVQGFVSNVDEWLDAADLAIGKSGGLTTSECLAKGVPLVVFAPIPGQEERNADYLLEVGAGVKAKDLATLAYRVEQLLTEPERRRRMSEAARAAARPGAALQIVSEVCGAGSPS
ncbi:MAG: glycosyltransferase [Planctomycetes bacterium]|nr:glycosyltransferase [Planctomycetota bacterium]